MTLKPRATVVATAIAFATISTIVSAQTTTTRTTMPNGTRGASLYYRLGGGDPAARAPNRNNTRIHLGVTGSTRLNYSCGKFSVQASMQDTINQLKTLDDVLMQAIQAAIAALPMYILQRAQPGLYELVQTYIQKARDLVNMSFASCEEMEKQIRDGRDPYDGYATKAMGEQWKEEANRGGDAVAAKQRVQTDRGQYGVMWVFDRKQGGADQEPIRIVDDLTRAAYNLTMMQPTTAPSNTNYSTTGSRLARAFGTPWHASQYAVDAIGDLQVATCEVGQRCAPKATSTGAGLNKKFEDEIPVVQGQLNTVFSATVPRAADLDAASAPGVLLTRDVVDAIHALPKADQAIAYSRLAQEIALARTVDRALLIRQLLMTGKTIPAATSDVVTQTIETKIGELNKSIENLMYEVRVRKELVTDTSTTLLQNYEASRSSAAATPLTPTPDPRPFVDGKVQ
jgi:integrating conjugative element protein (TIGR03755 family)